MTQQGGTSNDGCIFKINTDGTGFSKLLNFNGAANGNNPAGTLTLSGTTLYGTTNIGGANNLDVFLKLILMEPDIQNCSILMLLMAAIQ